MRKMVSAVLLGASLLVAGAANAQSYGGYGGYGSYNGYGRGYNGYERGDDWRQRDFGGGGVFRAVCSGARAQGLEARLRHEVAEGEINRYAAFRIHNVIDRLEDRQRQECAEGDRRSILEIAQRYDGIGQWIDREAHSDDRRW